MTARERFWTWLGAQSRPRVLEIGTRGWNDRPPIHHRDEVGRVCPSASWQGCDAADGPGVDVVADAHDLGRTFEPRSHDAVICVSTLEHLARPWIAARSMADVTRIGGLLWVETHQAFPIHGYPNDYFRFTTEGLKAIFSAESGWECLFADYSFPAKVVPLCNGIDNGWNFEAGAWLNVGGTFRRLG